MVFIRIILFPIKNYAELLIKNKWFVLILSSLELQEEIVSAGGRTSGIGGASSYFIG